MIYKAIGCVRMAYLYFLYFIEKIVSYIFFSIILVKFYCHFTLVHYKQALMCPCVTCQMVADYSMWNVFGTESVSICQSLNNCGTHSLNVSLEDVSINDYFHLEQKG